jgi:myo-inositol-1(or 4)-monophosphatase
MIGTEIARMLQEINPIIMRSMKSLQEVSLKPDESIVTATDRQVEQALLPELQKLVPGSSVIGEESAPTGPEAVNRLFQSDYLWAVDPIDGTVNFASGIPFFAVSVGLLERCGEGYSPIAAAISFPAFSEIYYTKKDRTFLKNIVSEEEHEVKRRNDDSVPVLLMPSSFRREYKADPENRLVSNVRQLGCTVANLIYVSVGKGSATFTSAHLWDFAASFAIARTLGLFPRRLSTGVFKEHFLREDFLFGNAKQHWRINEPLVLCEEKYFAEVQEILRLN